MISDKRIAIKFLLVFLSCVFVSGNAEVRCREREREALLRFKNGLIDDRGILSSWRSNECCKWYGVECSNTTGHVVTLKCNSNLRSKIGSSLVELHHLNHLDLSWNDFGGIPIPKFIGSMKQLQHLYLKSCNFSGTIPSHLGNLTSLRSLDLSGNDFRGPIPLSIGQLSNLQVLDLSYNSLEGIVFESHFIKLDKLKRLSLSTNPSLILDIASDWIPPFTLSDISLARCNVGPYFPSWIRTQMNLSSLDLSGANIVDKAPRWLWNMSPSLKSLYLFDNQISGTIPNPLSPSIFSMDVSYNQFMGPIPLFPANISNILLSGNMFSGSILSICRTRHDHLQYVDISNNQLSGEVPDCWEKMSNLKYLNLANNSFSGEIPRSLGALHNLGVLQVHGNNFCGELPHNLRLCQELIFIDVGGNKLTGEIPTWIGQLYEMRILNLRGNKFYGSIPSEMCSLTNIQVMDLSINNLSSIIPDCFNNFTVLSSKETTSINACSSILLLGARNLENLEYGFSSFQWKGKESEYWENLRLLKLIDFSSNRLTGNIPKSFSTMRGLISLNLSRNSLTGYIIPDIGKMEMLDSLDLSHNQISGEIPTSLVEIHTLGVLDLSNNGLSGKIPTSTQLQSFNASSYAANDGLCGDPLPKCHKDSLRPSITIPLENKTEKEGINFSFMQEVAISMPFGFIFGFWGVIGSIILKKSWRIAFFALLDAAVDWFLVFVSK